MFGSLLALSLAASPASPCAAIWSEIARGEGYRDVAANMLHGDPAREAALKVHFIHGCEALPPASRACGVAHPGRALLRACPALGQVFHHAATAPDVAGADLTQLRDQGLAREAMVNLRAIGQAARKLRLASGPTAQFTFPASAGPAPAGDCCQQPAKACASRADDWQGDTWKALGFAPTGPLRFHYRFRSSGTGRGARFTATATGRPDCRGPAQTWQVTGAARGSTFTVSAVVRRPPRSK